MLYYVIDFLENNNYLKMQIYHLSKFHDKQIKVLH